MKKRKTKFSSIQVEETFRDDVREFCTPRGLKISRFVERMFMVAVSGSSPDYMNEILGYKDK